MVISNGIRWWNNATICTHCPTGVYLYSIFTVVWISPCSTHQVFNFCKYLWSSVAIRKPITMLVFQKHTWNITDVIIILCNFGWSIDASIYCKSVILIIPIVTQKKLIDMWYKYVCMRLNTCYLSRIMVYLALILYLKIFSNSFR